MFNGNIHYKWSFPIAMLNYQRVLPTIHPSQTYLCGIFEACSCIQLRRPGGGQKKTLVAVVLEPSRKIPLQFNSTVLCKIPELHGFSFNWENICKWIYQWWNRLSYFNGDVSDVPVRKL